jgi:hypothetical protein
MDKFNEYGKNLKIYSIMKRIKLEKLFALGIIFLLITSSFLIFIPKIEAQNRFSGKGSGTPDDPYVITNVKQLQEMKYDLNAYYVLGNDIDASETRYWNNGQGFEPIGDYNNPFTGSFDGRGYKIYNLYINTTRDFGGLFGVVGKEGIIKNVGLENVKIISAYNNVGGLIGFNYYGTVSNSYSTGSVNGKEDVGGLVGENYYGTVSNSYSTGSVNGFEDVGGLVGYNAGTVSNSYSTGSVNGKEDVGGLVGYNFGTVSNSYSTGSVNGHKYVGGLIGYNFGTVSNSYSTGSVNGKEDVGGLVGVNFEGTVSNSYSTGSVNGHKYVGGLIGYNFGTVSNSYSTGSVNGKEYVGGLIGDNYKGTVSNSFWDIQTSGLEESAGGTGKTTEEMKNVRTYTDVGWSKGLDSPWDFVGNPYDDKGNEDIWDIKPNINNGYPYLTTIKRPIGKVVLILMATLSKTEFQDESSYVYASITNFGDSPIDVTLHASTQSPGWSVEPTSVNIHLGIGRTATVGFLVKFSATASTGTLKVSIEGTNKAEEVTITLYTVDVKNIVRAISSVFNQLALRDLNSKMNPTSAVVDFATSIIKKAGLSQTASDEDKAYALYDYVIKHMTYRLLRPHEFPPSIHDIVKEMNEHGGVDSNYRISGDCKVYSIFFGGLARALGLKVRPLAGVMEASRLPALLGHVWVEVYINGQPMFVDPTNALFGTVDTLHKSTHDETPWKLPDNLKDISFIPQKSYEFVNDWGGPLIVQTYNFTGVVDVTNDYKITPESYVPNSIVILTHSPVNLAVYDIGGNLVANGEPYGIVWPGPLKIDLNQTVPEGQFVVIQNPPDQLNIRLTGTAIGNYSLVIARLAEGNVELLTINGTINKGEIMNYVARVANNQPLQVTQVTTTPSPSPTTPVTTPTPTPATTPSAATPLNIELIIIIIVIAATLASLVIVFRKYKTK